MTSPTELRLRRDALLAQVRALGGAELPRGPELDLRLDRARAALEGHERALARLKRVNPGLEDARLKLVALQREQAEVDRRLHSLSEQLHAAEKSLRGLRQEADEAKVKRAELEAEIRQQEDDLVRLRNLPRRSPPRSRQ